MHDFFCLMINIIISAVGDYFSQIIVLRVYFWDVLDMIPLQHILNLHSYLNVSD